MPSNADDNANQAVEESANITESNVSASMDAEQVSSTTSELRANLHRLNEKLNIESEKIKEGKQAVDQKLILKTAKTVADLGIVLSLYKGVSSARGYNNLKREVTELGKKENEIKKASKTFEIEEKDYMDRSNSVAQKYINLINSNEEAFRPRLIDQRMKTLEIHDTLSRLPQGETELHKLKLYSESYTDSKIDNIKKNLELAKQSLASTIRKRNSETKTALIEYINSYIKIYEIQIEQQKMDDKIKFEYKAVKEKLRYEKSSQASWNLKIENKNREHNHELLAKKQAQFDSNLRAMKYSAISFGAFVMADLILKYQMNKAEEKIEVANMAESEKSNLLSEISKVQTLISVIDGKIQGFQFGQQQ